MQAASCGDLDFWAKLTKIEVLETINLPGPSLILCTENLIIIIMYLQLWPKELKPKKN